MAESDELFQEKMDAGSAAAWEKDWATAIKEFTHAVKLNPDDAEGYIQLGFALSNSERLDDALRMYLHACRLSPDDPVPLERVADVLEQLGRIDKAAEKFVEVAEIYLKHDGKAAIRNWERAVQLTPGLTRVHSRLAKAYSKMKGSRHKAHYHYLMVAYNYSRSDDTDRAIVAVTKALELHDKSTQGLNMLRALQAGQSVTLPEPPQAKSDNKTHTGPLPEEEEATPTPDISISNLNGPMAEAINDALVALADHVISSGSLDAAVGDALKAMEFQRQDQVADAITAYQRAEARFRHPALKLNLGVLLFLNNQPEEAVKHLGEALSDSTLSAGALHALGHSYYNLGEHKKASRPLIQSLQAIDTRAAASDREAVVELTQTYGQMLDAIDGRSNDDLGDVNEQFIEWLSDEGWKDQVPAIRKQIAEILMAGGDPLDFIRNSGSQQVASQLALVDKYISQKLWRLAMSSAFTAVEISPDYLPVHVRIATILMSEGRLRQAIMKYNIIARAYLARGENDRAADILAEVLAMVPMDVSVRLNLISLLEQENRQEDILLQSIELAKTYNKLGSFEQARDTYKKAAKLADEIEANVEQIVFIKHNLADMAQVRLENRQAIALYEEILELSPGDERAYRQLIDLHYSLANQVEAIRYLDEVLGLYAKKRQISKIVQMLEDLVKMYATDTGILSRLARIYKQLGRKREAVEAYDTLGKLQLEGGMLPDAIQTIKQIIALQPDGLADYQRLLSKLKAKLGED